MDWLPVLPGSWVEPGRAVFRPPRQPPGRARNPAATALGREVRSARDRGPVPQPAGRARAGVAAARPRTERAAAGAAGGSDRAAAEDQQGGPRGGRAARLPRAEQPTLDAHRRETRPRDRAPSSMNPVSDL